MSNLLPLASILYSNYKEHKDKSKLLVQSIACSIDTKSNGLSIITKFTDNSELRFVYSKDFTIDGVLVVTYRFNGQSYS